MTCFIPTLAFLVVKKKPPPVRRMWSHSWGITGLQVDGKLPLCGRSCAAAAAVYPMEVEMLG